MKLVRTGPYLKALKKLGASDADIAAVEMRINDNPEVGDVIPGQKGLRKVRFAMAGKGQKGGGRAIYYAVRSDNVVFMLTAYAKANKEDLTPDELKLFVRYIEELS